MKKAKAFTLIEVLVAMVILAIAFIAILQTTQTNISSSNKVRASLSANWVAMDVYAKLKIGLIKVPTSGKENILGQSWNWKISDDHSAEQSSFKRIVIDVASQDNYHQHLIGFIK